MPARKPKDPKNEWIEQHFRPDSRGRWRMTKPMPLEFRDAPGYDHAAMLSDPARMDDDTLAAAHDYAQSLGFGYGDPPRMRRAIEQELRRRSGGGAPAEQKHRGTQCVDCGVETLPTDERRAEWYDVKPEVWGASGIHPRGGSLCVGCLENRLGRRLTPADFSSARINDPNLESDNPRFAWSFRTPRLIDRLTGGKGTTTMDSVIREASKTLREAEKVLREAGARPSYPGRSTPEGYADISDPANWNEPYWKTHSDTGPDDEERPATKALLEEMGEKYHRAYGGRHDVEDWSNHEYVVRPDYPPTYNQPPYWHRYTEPSITSEDDLNASGYGGRGRGIDPETGHWYDDFVGNLPPRRGRPPKGPRHEGMRKQAYE